MIWYRPKTYAMPTMPSAEPTIELRQRWTRKGPSASVPRRTYMRVTRSSPSIVVLNSRASSPTRCQRIPSSSADSISARISMIGQFRVSEPMTGRFGLARLTSSGVTSATPIAATRLGVASTMACLVSSCMPRERSTDSTNAAANSSMRGKRWSRSLERARWRTSSTGPGTPGLNSRGLGGSTVWCWVLSSEIVSLWNGSRPATS